MLDVWSS